MSEIRPALSREEWKEFDSEHCVKLGGMIVEKMGVAGLGVGTKRGSTGLVQVELLPFAALALRKAGPNGTPLCTWEDLDALELVYRQVIGQPDPLGPELADAIERVYDLAARLAALLPPRELSNPPSP